MKQRGGAAEWKLEELASNLESFTLKHPQAAAPDSSTTDRTQTPEISGHVSLALVAACSPSGSQNFVMLQHVS